MDNQNIDSNKFNLFWTTSFSYDHDHFWKESCNRKPRCVFTAAVKMHNSASFYYHHAWRRLTTHYAVCGCAVQNNDCDKFVICFVHTKPPWRKLFFSLILLLVHFVVQWKATLEPILLKNSSKFAYSFF